MDDEEFEHADGAVRSLAQDARKLMAATAEATGETVVAARKRVAGAVNNGKHLMERLQHKVVEEAKAVDASAHRSPYKMMVLALGVGTILGVLLMQGRR